MILESRSIENWISRAIERDLFTDLLEVSRVLGQRSLDYSRYHGSQVERMFRGECRACRVSSAIPPCAGNRSIDLSPPDPSTGTSVGQFSKYEAI
jgi:hypothetical protein